MMKSGSSLVPRVRILGGTLFASALLLSGCDQRPTPAEGVTAVRASAQTHLLVPAVVNARRGQFLTYGQPVPVGQSLDRLPEPFDPIKHAAAKNDVIPGEMPPKGVQFPARGGGVGKKVGAAFVPPTVFTDVNTGIFFDSTSRGIEGLMDIRDDIVIPAGWYQALVYAPTLLPGGGSCIELTTIHWTRQDWGVSFNHGLGSWDWCGAGQWRKFAPFDSWFKERYARVYYDEWGQPREKYYAVVVADLPAGVPSVTDTWRVYLYNFAEGIYQQFDAHTGVGQIKNGWSMHESSWMEGYYNNGGCIMSPSTRTIGQNVRRPDGSWVPPTAAVGATAGVHKGPCFLNGAYTLYIDPTTQGDWWAWTPSNSQ